MADEQLIKPRELPAATTVFADDAIMTDNGSVVGKATPVQIVNAGAPVPTEAEAIAGTDNGKRMTPLTVKQVLDSVTAPSVLRAQAWAESDSPPNPGIPSSMSAKSWAAEAERLGAEQADRAEAAAADAVNAAPFAVRDAADFFSRTSLVAQSRYWSKDGLAWDVGWSDGNFRHPVTNQWVRVVRGTEGYDLLAFGADGNGIANDLVRLQSVISEIGPSSYILSKGVFNLGGGTLTLPPNSQVAFRGGLLTNGTISANECSFSGLRGLSDTITLTGALSSGRVSFDWFTVEKSLTADYAAFINGNSAAYGPVPAISNKNTTILRMLCKQKQAVNFGAGIYPFDSEILLAGDRFDWEGSGRGRTLLWAPNGHLIRYNVGGADYPRIRNMNIECMGSVIYSQAWSANAIHGLLMDDCAFISYASHAFHNDYSTSGGTGFPIYGTKVTNCGVFAATGFSGFFGWASGSNIYDNVVDQHFFFSGSGTRFKATMLALFHNSNCRSYCNSNIAYSAMEYVALYDRPSALFTFYASNNVFEYNSVGAFKAILKADAATSNIYLSTRNNLYIGTTAQIAQENGYAYILNVGNTYLLGTDSPTPLYGDTIRNRSTDYVRAVSTKLDASGTKYRMVYLEPHSTNPGNINQHSPSTLLTANAENAALVGMADIFAADSANISWIEVKPSYLVQGYKQLAQASGTTAQRPTFQLYTGQRYFDTTIGKPVWWSGSVWKDATGTTV